MVREGAVGKVEAMEGKVAMGGVVALRDLGGETVEVVVLKAEVAVTAVTAATVGVVVAVCRHDDRHLAVH